MSETLAAAYYRNIAKEEGYVFVFTDSQINKAGRSKQRMTLSLVSGDLILVEEAHDNESQITRVAKGPWLARVAFISDEERIENKYTFQPLDWLDSIMEYAGPDASSCNFCFFFNNLDEKNKITVLRRNGKPLSQTHNDANTSSDDATY